MLLKLNANETLNKKSPLIEGAIVKFSRYIVININNCLFHYIHQIMTSAK